MIRNIANRYFSKLSTKDFKKIYKLGEGANSKVYNVVSLSDRKMYTCKEYDTYSKNQVKKEEIILNMIQSENNVLPKYYSTIIEKDKTWLLTDYIEGDELFNKYCLRPQDPILNEDTIKPILKKMIYCIEECNKNNIVHLDIKPENYILSNYDNHISLIDFGCSQPFDDRNKLYNLDSRKIGTHSYCAPEVLYRNVYHINSDVWSLGVCIFSLLENKKLFMSHEINNPKKIYTFLEKFSPELQDLLKRIFVTYPHKRISLEEIKKHPFIKGKRS